MKLVKMTEDKKAEKDGSKITIKLPRFNLWIIVSLILAITLVLSLIQGWNITGKATGTVGTLSAAQAGQKTIDYINKNLVQPGTSATFLSIKELGSVYEVTSSYQGREIPIYISKDGSFIFLSAYNTSETIAQEQETPQKPQEVPKTDKPVVKFFVMSFCPYGQQAENGLGPVADLLGDKIVMEPHFVIYSNYGGGGPQYCLDSENKYCSMHGIKELNEDVRQLCIYKYNKDLFWDYVNKINSKCSSQNVDTCWEAIATEVGINAAKIKTCQSSEATELLKAEVELGTKLGVQGSPQVFINDVEYNGGRTPESYKQTICNAFTTQPSECSQTLSSEGSATASGGCG